MKTLPFMLLLLACGPADDDDGSGSGSAGRGGSGGSSAGTGASAGSGGSSAAANCEELWSEYEVLRDNAQRCDPSAAPAECDTSTVVFDDCGCSTPANATSPDYAEARRLGVEYSESCSFPSNCVDCPATLEAGCAADAASGVCEYR